MKTIAVATVVAAVVGSGAHAPSRPRVLPSRANRRLRRRRQPPTSPTSSTSATSTPSPGSGFGVVETTRRPLEPMAQTCEPTGREPGSQQVSFVQGARPGTPIVELLAPENWTFAPSPVDPTLNLTGPDGMTGTVTVAPTELEPAEAFDKYADDAMAKAPIAALSVLPGELCGYSGQKLMGMVGCRQRGPGRVSRPHRARLDQLRVLSGRDSPRRPAGRPRLRRRGGPDDAGLRHPHTLSRC